MTDSSPSAASTATTAEVSPTISIVMPVYQAEAYLERVLPPLRAALENGDVLEVLIIDDGSTDRSPELCRAAGLDVRLSERRAGPAAARNRGAREARGDVLLFLDADTVMHADVPQRVRAEFASRPDCVALFGSYDDRPGHPGWVSQYRNLLHHYVHQKGKEEASTFWSGCGAIRREVFEAVGGFDLARFEHASVEDIELGQRLRAAGHSVRLCKDVQVKHLKHWTLGNMLHTDIFRRARPWSRMLIESPETARALNLSNAERGRALLALGFWGALLIAPVATAFLPLFGLLPVVLLVLSLAASWDFYRLVGRCSGVGPMATAMALHQLYYLYSAVVYGWTRVEHLVRGPSSAPEGS